MPAPREVLPGVYLVSLPLPFSLNAINVYLVRVSGGYMLIDCGMDTGECEQTLQGALESIGASWRDIRQIFLTHVHPDHMGFAPRLLRMTGARLLMHAEDVEYLEQLAESDDYRQWASQVLRRAGVAEDMIASIEKHAARVHLSFQKLSPDVTLAGGEKIATAMGELEVVWTPGHSPGHVCLYGVDHRALFSGDQILTDISPNIGWHPGRDPLGEYLLSLEDLAQRDINLVLPAHGEPFSGHREWIRKTIEHHAARCARILAELDGQAKTAADLVPGLWDRPLTPFHYRFAVFEILAHLEYLERQGKVARTNLEEVFRWRSCSRSDVG